KTSASTNWAITYSGNAPVSGIAASPTGDIFAVAIDGSVRVSLASSQWTSWTNLAALTHPLFAINVPAASVGWACGDSGAIYKTTNSGAAWNLEPSGTT